VNFLSRSLKQRTNCLIALENRVDVKSLKRKQRLSTLNLDSEQMKIICAVCGQFSESKKRCTNCGAEIVSEEEIERSPIRLEWGWAVFSFNTADRMSKEKAMDYMRERWEHLEGFTQLSLIDSQLVRFFVDAINIKLLVREDLFHSLSRDLSKHFSFLSGTFERIGVVTVTEANALLETIDVLSK
jgi:hypothetical protein